MNYNQLKVHGKERNRVGEVKVQEWQNCWTRKQRTKLVQAVCQIRFEGGTTIIPCRGSKTWFQNINRKEYEANLRNINRFEDGQEATAAVLVEAGIIKTKDGIVVS